MILSLIDYSIPRICTYVSQPQQWTAANGTHAFCIQLFVSLKLLFDHFSIQRKSLR